MKRFTDIHHHLLYGLDDGADSRKMMYAMLRRASQEGIGRIVATPHVTPGVHRFKADQFLKAIEEASEYCRSHALNIEVFAGSEILYTDQTCRLLQDGLIPTLAGTDRVLVEFSPDISYRKLWEALDRLLSAGYLPVVAHVERYDCLTRHPKRAVEIKERMDVYYQVNTNTVLCSDGRSVRRFVQLMMEDELIDAVASDAHNITVRAAKMLKAWDVLSDVYGTIYANRLLSGELLED